MDYLTKTASGKIYPEWDLSRALAQDLWDREEARLRREYMLLTMQHKDSPELSIKRPQGLLELLQELVSLQELR